MAMTRQHYIVLARILGENGIGPFDAIVTDLTAWLKGDNPNHDPDRFREAVGNAYTGLNGTYNYQFSGYRD